MVAAAIFFAASGHAQVRDTLKLTLKQAEDQFLEKNLSLMAARYNIDQAKASIITARLFENPTVGFENILYNPETRKVFDLSHDGGQYNASISQLFQTAGKRNKNIALAKITVQQAQYQFFDLLRTLRYTLRTDFYTIYFKEQSAAVYQEEIGALQKTLVSFRQQYQQDNIAKKEVLRIQSQLYTLQAELASLQDEIDDTQSEFKLLIHSAAPVYIYPVSGSTEVSADVLKGSTYAGLLDAAERNRYDLQAAQASVEYSTVNLKLQRALAVPDFSLSLTYDKNGSTVRNYSGVGISIPIPLFNRNQGAIRAARVAIDQSKVTLNQQQEQIRSELDNSYQSALRLEGLLSGFDPVFRNDFNTLIEQVMLNYRKRNIGILEFLDFYDSYKTNALQMNMLQLNQINALEQLNYVTGTSLFNRTNK